MGKFDEMIYGLQQDMAVPDDVWMKYTETLSNLPDKQAEKTPPTSSRRKIWPMVVAATLVIGTISVSAATYIQWSKGLEERLQITNGQRQLLENNQMSSYVGQSVTLDGITVTVQESIVDNHFAYLSFKVEGYTIEDGEEPAFSHVDFYVNNKSWYSGGWSAGFYKGSTQDTDKKTQATSYIMEDGSMEYQVVMMSDVKGYFIDKPIHVELKDLGIYNAKTKNVDVNAEGNWCFDWILTGSDAMEQYELHASLEDSGATVLNAELSPISISITYEHPKQEMVEKITAQNGDEITHTTYKRPPEFTGVRLKDGTIYTNLVDSEIRGYMEENSAVYEYTASLKQIIDAEQVESLLFIKSYPDENQSLAEENLYFVSLEQEK